MRFSLRFLPEVEEDAINGYTWYESKSPGIGEEFLRIFYNSANEISLQPQRYAKVHNEFRRCLLKKFPYVLYFTIEDDQIVVYGLFHCARDPWNISMILQEREEAN